MGIIPPLRSLFIICVRRVCTYYRCGVVTQGNSYGLHIKHSEQPSLLAFRGSGGQPTGNHTIRIMYVCVCELIERCMMGFCVVRVLNGETGRCVRLFIITHTHNQKKANIEVGHIRLLTYLYMFGAAVSDGGLSSDPGNLVLPPSVVADACAHCLCDTTRSCALGPQMRRWVRRGSALVSPALKCAVVCVRQANSAGCTSSSYYRLNALYYVTNMSHGGSVRTM